MKKRIIAILLSLSVFCCSLSFCKRASAAPAVGAIMAIGVLAWEIIGVCTGMYDDTAAAIGEFIESGVDGFINPDSEFQQNWSAGWGTICHTVEGWFNNGEVEIVDGRVNLTYDQFHELYSQTVSVMSKPDIDFQTGFNCLFLDVDLSRPITLDSLPIINEYFTTNGQAFAPVYFNDEIMIFSDSFMFVYESRGSSGSFVRYSYGPDFKVSSYHSFCSYEKYEIFLDNCLPWFFLNLNFFRSSYTDRGTENITEFSPVNCFVYDNGTLTCKPVSEVDVSGMKSGLIATTAAYGDFLKSIKGYSSNLVPPANLDDLSGVLPTEYNPTLSFPVDPDLTRPLPNQVTVGNVPGVADLPLSEYQAKLDTDIDIPSIICTKFPFCIPYDFIRFLGLLCSDPVAPVFRIPISTSPDNLEQWSGNVTVNEYLTPDDPMFEIDEEIVIDLSGIPLVQPICYTCFIVGFIFLLIHITPNMIQH